VQKELNFSGEIPAEQLLELASAVESCESVFAEVEFKRDVEGENKHVIELRVDAVVNLSCQRCLEPVQITLSPRTRLVLVKHDEEAKNRIKDCEPLILDQDELELYGLVEEELSLALPVVAYHESDELAACEQRFREKASNSISLHSLSSEPNGLPKGDANRHRPFGGLADLLGQSTS